MQYETVIGLEVHVQLSTKSKLFSGSAAKFGAEPNTQANIFDLAMPGTLPVLNGKAVAMAVKFGVAIGAEIGKHSVFDRKNYFYPDLPKGYQVSQLDYPTVGEGTLTVTLDDGSEKVIGVTRAHMEEDAGKSLHEDYQGMTGIDLNRAGTPLLTIIIAGRTGQQYRLENLREIRNAVAIKLGRGPRGLVKQRGAGRHHRSREAREVTGGDDLRLHAALNLGAGSGVGGIMIAVAQPNRDPVVHPGHQRKGVTPRAVVDAHDPDGPKGVRGVVSAAKRQHVG